MSENQMLGVDVGFAHTGIILADVVGGDDQYLFKKWWCLHTEKSDKKLNVKVASDDIRRSQDTARLIWKILKDFPNIKALAIEAPTGGAKGARAQRCMGIATGIIATITELAIKPVVWVVPTDTKKLVCGTKSASKEAVWTAMMNMHPELEWPTTKKDLEHVADAGGALCVAANSDIYKMLLQ